MAAPALLPLHAPSPVWPAPDVVSDFAAFDTWVRALPLGDRGPVWETFVEAYLRLTPALGIAKVWRPADPRLPDAVLERLGLARLDVGQDFVALTHDDQLWIVQAKFRSDASALTWEDVRGAVAAGRRADRILLVSNVRALSGNCPPGIMEAHVGTVLRHDLAPLGLDFFTAFAAYRAGRVAPARAPQPRRDYQIAAVADVVAEFEAGAPRAQLIAACGTGKTRMGLWIMEDLDAQEAIFFAPSLALVSQTVGEWTQHAAAPIDVICVCSDKDAGDLHAQELAVPVTTKATVLRDQWTRPRRPGARRVIFSTYHSAAVVRQALSEATLAGASTPELIVCDEAHRIAGDQDKDWQLVLDDAALPAQRRLFMTATPRTVSQELKDAGIGACMDDVALFGRVAHHVSFRRAISLGILADYRLHVFAVATTDRRTREMIRRRKFVLDAGGRKRPFHAGEIAQAIALENAFMQGQFHYAFTFHNRKQHARTFLEACQKVWSEPQLQATNFCVVTGEHSLRERRGMLERALEHRQAVIASVRALSEGVDVPAVDAVVFADPRESVIDIVQAIGRALRKRPGEASKTASIVIPVPVESMSDPKRDIDGTAWRTVWNVIEAMSEHDGELAEHLATLREELGAHRPLPERRDAARAYVDAHLIVHLPDSRGVEALRRGVNLAVVDRGAWAFWHMRALFRAYAFEHPHVEVETKYRGPAGENLSRWVAEVRDAFRARRLTEEHVAAMEDTPGWYWSADDTVWHHHRHQVAAFAQRTGWLPTELLVWTSEERELMTWVREQTTLARRDVLAADRRAALATLPKWAEGAESWEFELFASATAAILNEEPQFAGLALQVPERPASYASWNGGYDSYGALRVSEFRKHVARWGNRQRALHRDGRLPAERVTRLERIAGWVWDPAAVRAVEKAARAVAKEQERAARQANRQAALATFVATHGVAPGARSAPVADKDLEKWLDAQRRAYRDGALSAETRDVLEALPGWTWDSGLEEFLDNVERARPYVADSYKGWLPWELVTTSGERLGEWVAKQRQNHHRGWLNTARVAAIESLPGWSWDQGETIARHLNALQAYVAEHPGEEITDATVYRSPGNRSREAVEIGAWAARQRTAYRAGKLTDAAIVTRLEAIPGWRWDRLTDHQERMLEALEEYMAAHERQAPPRGYKTESGLELGTWTRTHLKQVSEGRLSAGLGSRLAAIEGWDTAVERYTTEEPKPVHRCWIGVRLGDPLTADSTVSRAALAGHPADAIRLLGLVAISDGEDVTDDGVVPQVDLLDGGCLLNGHAGPDLPSYGVVWRRIVDQSDVAGLERLHDALADDPDVSHVAEQPATAYRGIPEAMLVEWWVAAEPSMTPSEVVDRAIAVAQRVRRRIQGEDVASAGDHP